VDGSKNDRNLLHEHLHNENKLASLHVTILELFELGDVLWIKG